MSSAQRQRTRAFREQLEYAVAGNRTQIARIAYRAVGVTRQTWWVRLALTGRTQAENTK